MKKINNKEHLKNIKARDLHSRYGYKRMKREEDYKEYLATRDEGFDFISFCVYGAIVIMILALVMTLHFVR